MIFAAYASEMESPDFDPEEFVERQAWKLGSGSQEQFNADALHHGFVETIKFKGTQDRIHRKYDEIEKKLINDFVYGYRNGNKERMQQIVDVFKPFKGYPHLVEAFIEESLQGAFGSNNYFREIPRLCKETVAVISAVFRNKEQVLSKFLSVLYSGRLKEFIQSQLPRSDPASDDLDQYLDTFASLYSKTQSLSRELSDLGICPDPSSLQHINKSIFENHLKGYPSVELDCLRKSCASTLHKYYADLGHQKKNISNKTVSDFLDLQSVKAVMSQIGQGSEEHEESFLSEHTAISILEETKNSLKRSQMLSKPSQLANNVSDLFQVLTTSLMEEHLEYALDLGLESIPGPDSKSPPKGRFFGIVRQANAIVVLYQKLFEESVVPLISASPKHKECLQRKRNLLKQMEIKMDAGIERSLTAIMGYVRQLFVEQKKTDFRRDSTDMSTESQSPAACPSIWNYSVFVAFRELPHGVVRFMTGIIQRIKDGLDGANLESTMTELGIRFHRAIYEHLLQFQYNSAGAMCVICDVNEYRHLAQEFGIPLIASLFDTLHALCNLLIVPLSNIQQICMGEALASLDRSVLVNFIQLRVDSKAAKITL
ncbi:unnamed protein product [Cyprideis torosa]|uniref:Exocyst complex component Sec10-like alpha-helical bundle domain-containing protein n=1 Tax=Cyprideis torosa TaxID=163714 RepID=A0A7R8WAQ1_9CRUS|nr:unnamed protein product [Cyprideis torosa]CAG0885714.1 unnamed protein product [Cyprideis torosa]